MTITLVDTSVWVDHLRHGNNRLASLLDEGNVLCHPFVVGELACGNLAHRDHILDLLGALPETPIASHEEIMALMRLRELHGKGLGWIDMHLVASALLAGCPLWTLDKTLHSTVQTSRFGPVRP